MFKALGSICSDMCVCVYPWTPVSTSCLTTGVRISTTGFAFHGHERHEALGWWFGSHHADSGLGELGCLLGWLSLLPGFDWSATECWLLVEIQEASVYALIKPTLLTCRKRNGLEPWAWDVTVAMARSLTQARWHFRSRSSRFFLLFAVVHGWCLAVSRWSQGHWHWRPQDQFPPFVEVEIQLLGHTWPRPG